MGLEVRVAAADLTSVRKALRKVGDVGLGKQLAGGLVRAARPIGPAVRAEVPKAMPSGYAPVLSRSLRFRTAVRGTRTTARMTIRVYGDGQKERRDVPRLNRGELRHPVFGRTRPLKNHAKYKATSMKNPWVAQKVRKGFVDRPVDRLAPDIAREMQAVVDWVAGQITKG